MAVGRMASAGRAAGRPMRLAAALGGLLWIAVAAQAQRPGTTETTLAQANAALQAGQADKALALIAALPEGGANDALAQNLICRLNYTMQLWNEAAKACAQAVRLDDGNSNYRMWYGRALGEVAERASFMSAFGLGKQVRAEFEAAARLNPRNGEALTDLGSFYESAPGIVGGGMDKAESVAAELDRVDQARAHQLRGSMAEDRKDYATAERELKQATQTSAHPALQWTVLAGFYRRRQRWAEMETAVHNAASAAARDRSAGVAFYDGAGVLMESKRDLALAEKMLEEYMASPSESEEAPVFVAHYRLARLMEQLGDSAGAGRERSAAYGMAREYKPPQDGKG